MILITPTTLLDTSKVTDLVQLKCELCETIFKKEKREVQKVLKHIKTNGYKSGWLRFCGYACSSRYKCINKKTGDNRSKLERWIEKKLSVLYPSLEIHYSRRDRINAELDIFIPSLNLAFELNGIFHYEPIFGEKRLKSAKDNDERKFQACIENKIELCIIDTSKLSGNFSEKKYEKYFEIINSIITQKLTPIVPY
jgi:hypothetical protein